MQRTSKSPYIQSPYIQSPYTKSPYTESLYTESMYTESMYTESMYTESMYTESMYTESPPTDNIYPTNIAQPAPGNLDPTRKFYVTPRTIYHAPRPDPTYIDPGGAQEALRFFQPVKNDPKLDFYAMYKRETTEYDSEDISKYNEDLDTTLIFAGLFSTVSSAFVVAIQPELRPDHTERSEAYLQAIFLSLNKSTHPGESPTLPPAWSGPPQEIVTVLNLLYASLLISLLAAFIAMLGKQWLTRYFRHTGKSTIERCVDRQRKYDGLNRWPFHLFLGCPPLMLQIALFLLACGLSRYMWSVNTSVARIIISFTTLGFLFYIGIVVAGISSYECPFQTPASEVIRYLRDSGIAKKVLKSPSNIDNLLSSISQDLSNARHWLASRIRSHGTPVRPVPENDPTPRFHIQDLKSIQQQNGDNARCVSWVLRNITEPEAIDAAIRLAADIRWFSDDSTYEPPFDLIVPIFEACFDPTKRLYPGSRDRAYFSAQAIFQIHMRAKVRPDEDDLRYPIPVVSSSWIEPTDPNLHHIFRMLECNSAPVRPTFHLPDVLSHTPTHPLRLSNLFVDLTHTGQNPSLESYRFYLLAAASNKKAVIANILLMWWMFLGGHVEDKMLWSVDKSDSLEEILSHLSRRLVDLISQGRCPKYLNYLLEFLAAWEERPVWLTPMAYMWCSAISRAAITLNPNIISQPRLLSPPPPTPSEEEFSQVGRSCDIFRSGDLSGHPQALFSTNYMELLPLTLKIGFRQVGNGPVPLQLDHTIYHDLVFKAAFSSNDDDTIADALSVWTTADYNSTPPNSVAEYLSRRVERTVHFSSRLRSASIHVIERIWHRELGEWGPEVVRLLNRLWVGAVGNPLGQMVGERQMLWGRLLVSIIRSPAGLRGLSLDYWRLLGDLLTDLPVNFFAPDVEGFLTLDVEVTESLARDGAEEWEKLEVWMGVIWRSILPLEMLTPRVMQDIEQVTLKLLLKWPSVIPKFEILYGGSDEVNSNEGMLRRICNKAIAANVPSAPPSVLVGREVEHLSPSFPL